MERPIIQVNEQGKAIITALVDVARKVVPLNEVTGLMTILGLVTPIPPQSGGESKISVTENNPAEVEPCLVP